MAEINPEQAKDDGQSLYLPPGFRFHPTDEEIITCYLAEKVVDQSFEAVAMGEADLNKCEPWDLPSKAKIGEKEWYFFCRKEKRYPTGTRTNRATESGYWKATGKDKEIHKGREALVGMKKTLVFYRGRAPKGEKTNWVMHEFRLEGNYSQYFNLPKISENDWVVVRVFQKNDGVKKIALNEESNAAMEDFMSLVPPQNPGFVHSGSTSYGHLNHFSVANNNVYSPFIGQAKVEQLSNSMASTSRDTGLSIDRNADISSYDYGHSSGLMFDLQNIWNY